MKLLFLSSRPPYPPDRGDKVRLQMMLQAFMKLGHVTLVCLVDPVTDLDSMAKIRKQVSDVHFVNHGKLLRLWNLMVNIFSKTPFQVAYYSNPRLRKILAELSYKNTFDAVYVHLIRMAPYGMLFDPERVILDYTDCISLEYKRSLKHRSLYARLFFTIEAKRTAEYEFNLKNKFAQNWVISPVDFMEMRMQDDGRCLIMPNSVSIAEPIKHSGTAWRLIFSGNMSIPHNVSAAIFICEKIMPVLVQKFPELVFIIAGAAPSPSVKALDGKNNTQVLGFVQDLYQELAKADIFLAPMYFSAGVQNKVLEAMACGLPVITTSNVALSLECVPGSDLIVADNQEDIISACCRFLEDESLRAVIGSAGHAYVQSRFSTHSIQALISQSINTIMYHNDTQGVRK